MLDELLAFCAELRDRYGFRLGPGEEIDAVRALDAVGLADPRRVRRALRLVCCASHEECALFDIAFDAFFYGRPPGAALRVIVNEALQSSAESNDHDDAESWPNLVAHYSPASAAAEQPALAPDDTGEYARAARNLIASVHRGRSRRWRPAPRGPRLDPRRTLRTSLHTAGDPVVLRRLAHPHRNPRFVLILDGSRSMAPYADAMLGLAEALVRRTSRVRVLLFSTDVRDVTRDLRAVHRLGTRVLDDLGAAWGGGTRIGSALRTFVRTGTRWLSPDTLVLVYSDGLDSGARDDIPRALHAITRAGADLVWLHPHADRPGFIPATAALRAAEPYVRAFASPATLSS